MFKSLLIISLSAMTLLSCNDSSVKQEDLEPYMVSVNEFQLNDSILKDGDQVRILGSTGKITEEHKIDFYNLVVVVSETTDDTINVLVTNFFQSNSNDPYVRFFSNTSLLGKIVEITSNGESIEKQKLEDMKVKSYTKVFYDTDYIQVDVRKYPAIIGNLGAYTIEGDISTLSL